MERFRHVFERYPVAQLPDDLREGLDPNAFVTITIEAEGLVQSGEIVIERRFVFESGRVTQIEEQERQG